MAKTNVSLQSENNSDEGGSCVTRECDRESKVELNVMKIIGKIKSR